MLNIIVNKKDIVKVFKDSVLIGYVEHKGKLYRELLLDSPNYKIIIND